jgi:cytochrome c biogenesis protein CcmG/thiol:disulfide interchange protein DsbE
MRVVRVSGKLRFLMLAAAFSLLPPAGGVLAVERETAPGAHPVAGGGGIRPAESGSVAPDFTLVDVEGRPFHLGEEAARKPVLLVFWSMFCDPCRAEMATLQRFHDRYGGRDLTAVAVAVDGEPLRNTLGGFVRQEGYTFTVLVDGLDAREMWKVADAYGVAEIPTLFLVGKGGVVAFGRAGRVREDELEKAVSSTLKK